MDNGETLKEPNYVTPHGQLGFEQRVERAALSLQDTILAKYDEVPKDFLAADIKFDAYKYVLAELEMNTNTSTIETYCTKDSDDEVDKISKWAYVEEYIQALWISKSKSADWRGVGSLIAKLALEADQLAYSHKAQNLDDHPYYSLRAERLKNLKLAVSAVVDGLIP